METDNRSLLGRVELPARPRKESGSSSEAYSPRNPILIRSGGSSSQSRLLLYNPDEPLLPQDVHVLFVEDEPVSRRLGVTTLRNEGYKVTEAADGDAAWRLLNEAPYEFELIVSDVGMPKMTGTQLLARLRGDDRFSDTAIVMMSCTDEAEVCYGCLTNGADDFLIKPLRSRKVANLWQVVWKKRKETLTAFELAEEKRKRHDMAEAISSLHERISTAVETPLAHVIASLDSFLENAEVDPMVVAGIREALAALGERSLYQNAFEETLLGSDMDSNTKAWLLNQVRSATAGTPSGDKNRPVLLTPTRIPSWDSYGNGNDDDAADAHSDWSEYSAEPDEEDILDQLADIEHFEMLSLSEDDMVRYLVIMFNSLNGPPTLHIEPEVFEGFVIALRDTYRDNPYHNFRHAFDVSQFVHWLLTQAHAVDLLPPLDVVGVFVAALCHDADHPGLNNNFQINSLSPLALRYNDASVLENHHAAVSFSLILGATSSPEINIFANLSKSHFKSIRKTIVASILGTDLASHVDIMRRWEEIASTYDQSCETHRQALCVLLVKCGDISNPMRPFNLAKFWSDMIIEEGLHQGATEAAMGIPISPGMDPDTINQCKMSVGFIDYFVMPSFRSLEKVLPRVGDVGIPMLTKNRYRWQALLDVQDACKRAQIHEQELLRQQSDEYSDL